MSAEGIRVTDYLGHILEAIARISRYTFGMDVAEFLIDEMAQDAVIRNIEIVGEAARNIEQRHPEFAARHPDVPWEDMYLMCNRVSHGYFAVDLEIVWKTVKRDLPEKETRIAAICSQSMQRQDDRSGSSGPQ